MPYTIDNPPESMKDLPKDLVRQWITVFNRLVDEHGEDSARKQAWGAIKKSWEQDGDGNWRRRSEDGGRKAGRPLRGGVD
jgi:cation transport regulator ChaB